MIYFYKILLIISKRYKSNTNDMGFINPSIKHCFLVFQLMLCLFIGALGINFIIIYGSSSFIDQFYQTVLVDVDHADISIEHTNGILLSF